MIVSVDEYESWLSRELERLVKPASGKGRKLVDEAGHALEEGRGLFLDLSRKGDRDMDTKHDPVSYRAARVLGHAGKQGSEMLSKVYVPTEVSWESLRAFKDTLSSTGKALKDLRNRSQSEMSGLYILDMRSFGGVGDRIGKNGERLASFLEGEGAALQKARTLTGISATLEEAVRELRSLEEEVSRVSVEQHRVMLGVESLRREFEAQTSDPNVASVLQVERELRKESRDFRSITLAHLQRPLRRLYESSMRGEVPLALSEREALAKYIEKPYRTFLTKDTGVFLAPILSNLRKAVDSGKLGFKPRKASRVLTQLGQLVSPGYLEARQKHGRELLSRRRTLLGNPSCKSLYASRKETFQRLEEEKKRLLQAQERVKVLGEKSRLADQRVGELIGQAEARSREFLGKDIQLQRPKLRTLAA